MEKKQVFLYWNRVWADIESEDDRQILAFDPVDGVATYVDKKEAYTRIVRIEEDE
jgi:hypothetical protein